MWQVESLSPGCRPRLAACIGDGVVSHGHDRSMIYGVNLYVKGRRKMCNVGVEMKKGVDS